MKQSALGGLKHICNSRLRDMCARRLACCSPGSPLGVAKASMGGIVRVFRADFSLGPCTRRGAGSTTSVVAGSEVSVLKPKELGQGAKQRKTAIGISNKQQGSRCSVVYPPSHSSHMLLPPMCPICLAKQALDLPPATAPDSVSAVLTD